jgi:hypothetical protein
VRAVDTAVQCRERAEASSTHAGLRFQVCGGRWASRRGAVSRVVAAGRTSSVDGDGERSARLRFARGGESRRGAAGGRGRSWREWPARSQHGE